MVQAGINLYLFIVVQARKQQRRRRSGAEYCHNQVDSQLATEQRNLLDLINKLKADLAQAQQCLVQLHWTQLEVSGGGGGGGGSVVNIGVFRWKTRSLRRLKNLYIDKVKCGTVSKGIIHNHSFEEKLMSCFLVAVLPLV